MSNYRNTNDLKKEVLKKCGELQDGTSAYDSYALTYLNNLYRNVLSGGNEFNVDLSEPWSWAIVKRPLVITLLPAISTGSVTATLGSYTVTFSVAPLDTFGNSISVKGWHLKVDNLDEYYIVQAHNAGATTAFIDVAFTETTTTTTFNLYKFDYDLIDDTVVVTTMNQKLDFKEAGGALVATLTPSVYTPAAFATHVATQLTGAGTQTYTGSWDSVRRVFTFSAPTTNFSFLFVTGPNFDISPAGIMGFDLLDMAGAKSYTATYPLNAINRICGPMQEYRRNNTQFLAAPDEGKIYEVDLNTFIRKLPLTQVTRAIPDQFCVLYRQANGITTVRMNAFVLTPTKVEVFVIELHRDLQDNIASIPVMPHMYRDALVFGATHYVMLDKADDRAVQYATLCAAKLKALVHHNRKELSLAGNNYGKLVPRAGQAMRKYITEIS